MLFFSICVGLVGGDMRGVVRAFEAKLNKFLKFYAMSILKIENTDISVLVSVAIDCS